ncbi:MAG: elongation factor 4, partial [Planctomycetes bacterium]|nr:elongation factor 4 [Planctomycetota bacterium]
MEASRRRLVILLMLASMATGCGINTAVLQPGGPESLPSSDPRVVLEAALPMAEVLVDFYDQVKTRSRGYASMDYTFGGYRTAPLVRLDILVNEVPVDALSLIP